MNNIFFFNKCLTSHEKDNPKDSGQGQRTRTVDKDGGEGWMRSMNFIISY